MMIRNDFGRKKILVKKIFWGLVFKLKFFITMSMTWMDFDKKLKKNRSRSLKYCSEVIRSLGKRFFDPKYHVEVVSWPCGQNKNTRTKKLCPPHIFARFGSRVFIYYLFKAQKRKVSIITVRIYDDYNLMDLQSLDRWPRRLRVFKEV